MTLELKKPFRTYVAVDELAPTGDARKFVANLPFQREGTIKMEHRRHEWTYSGTQTAIDQKNGVDGVPARTEVEVARLQRAVEDELKKSGERLYEVSDTKFPVWGKKK